METTAIPTAFPTPYDITAIPFFAYTPGAILWGALLLLFLSIIILNLLLKTKQNSKKYKLDPYAMTMAELSTLTTNKLDKIQLTTASQIIKRYLSLKLNIDLNNMSYQELQLIAEQKKLAEFSNLVSKLLQLDNLRYGNSANAPDLAAYINEIKSSLEILDKQEVKV